MKIEMGAEYSEKKSSSRRNEHNEQNMWEILPSHERKFKDMNIRHSNKVRAMAGPIL